MNANVQKNLDGVPVPSHLLLLNQAFRDDFFDPRLDKPSGYPLFCAVQLTVIGHGVCVRLQIAYRLQKHVRELLQGGDVLETPCLRPLPKMDQTDCSSLGEAIPNAPLRAVEGRTLRYILSGVSIDRRAFLSTPTVFHFHRSIEPHLDQMKQIPVNNAECYLFKKFYVWSRVKVADQIRANRTEIGVAQQPDYFAHGILSIPILSIGVLLRRQLGLEDCSQDQHSRCLAHSISQPGNTKRPEFSIWFRNKDPSDRTRSIGSFLELLRQFPEPSLCAISLDILERDAVYARSALFGAAAGISVCEQVHPI